jgi:enolase
MAKIIEVNSRWVLDSRGLPTVQTMVEIESEGKKYSGAASVPSGASTGTYEALELRDGNKEFTGKGVSKAVKNVNSIIAPKIKNQEYTDALVLDKEVLSIDKSSNKSELGANAILSVSMAAHRAFAASLNQQLWQYLEDLYFADCKKDGIKMPRLMCNIINGGVHADSGLAIQEFMVVPKTGDIEEDVRCASEVYHTLKKNLKKDGHSISLGDEGGFAPHIPTSKEALDYIQASVAAAGYGKDKYDLALDCAASEFMDKETGKYTVDGVERSGEEMVEFYGKMAEDYNIVSIEDAFGEDDFESWSLLKKNLGDKFYQIGDDLFVTNVERFRNVGLQKDLGSGVLIKLNQIGSVSETCDMINLAKKEGYVTAVSHRSGETTDSFISDLAVASHSEFIKLGAPARGERVAKFNRLLEISDTLND